MFNFSQWHYFQGYHRTVFCCNISVLYCLLHKSDVKTEIPINKWRWVPPTNWMCYEASMNKTNSPLTYGYIGASSPNLMWVPPPIHLSPLTEKCVLYFSNISVKIKKDWNKISSVNVLTSPVNTGPQIHWGRMLKNLKNVNIRILYNPSDISIYLVKYLCHISRLFKLLQKCKRISKSIFKALPMITLVQDNYWKNIPAQFQNIWKMFPELLHGIALSYTLLGKKLLQSRLMQ